MTTMMTGQSAPLCSVCLPFSRAEFVSASWCDSGDREMVSDGPTLSDLAFEMEMDCDDPSADILMQASRHRDDVPSQLKAIQDRDAPSERCGSDGHPSRVMGSPLDVAACLAQSNRPIAVVGGNEEFKGKPSSFCRIHGPKSPGLDVHVSNVVAARQSDRRVPLARESLNMQLQECARG